MGRNYIGPKQRPIIEALKAGAKLCQANGDWGLKHTDGAIEWLNRERASALYVRGFVMADGDDGVRWLYTLTEKGKQA